MSLAGSDQAPAVMVPWAGTECTYTAWAHAGALSRASALTYYLYTNLPHQIPLLRLEEDIPTRQSPVAPFCSVIVVLVGGGREKHGL